MDNLNGGCNGFQFTLKSCYKIINSLHCNSNSACGNICDEPFNHYIICLQVMIIIYLSWILFYKLWYKNYYVYVYIFLNTINIRLLN